MAKAFLKSINMPHVNIPFSKLDWNGFTIMSICAWHMECFFPRNQNHECYIILCLPIKSINLQYITKNSVGNRKKWNRPIISRVILFLNLLNWYDFGMLQFTCTDTIDYFLFFSFFDFFNFLFLGNTVHNKQTCTRLLNYICPTYNFPNRERNGFHT